MEIKPALDRGVDSAHLRLAVPVPAGLKSELGGQGLNLDMLITTLQRLGKVISKSPH